jgi:hypothetical protein
MKDFFVAIVNIEFFNVEKIQNKRFYFNRKLFPRENFNCCKNFTSQEQNIQIVNLIENKVDGKTII